MLLRAFNIGHVLSFDEAWNINTIASGAAGKTSGFYFFNFWRHPPLYTGLGIAFAALTAAGPPGVAVFMQVVSLASALSLVVMIFMCGRDWFGEKEGLLAAFIFAVIPAARFFDTWVKQESLTLLLCLVFLFLFFRKKPFLAGLVLGLAFLTKEIAIFTAVALAIFVLLVRRTGMVKKLMVSYLVAVLASMWWYLFFSVSVGAFTNFFLGRGRESANWAQAWSYYLGRFPRDVGWPVAVLIVLSLVLVFGMPKRLRSDKKNEAGYSSSSMGFFLAVWIAVVYLALSISYGKPPWMVYSALPAISLLGGFGLVHVGRLIPLKKEYVLSLLCMFLVVCLVLSITVGFERYMLEADPFFFRVIWDKEVADYVNSVVGKDGRVMLTVDLFVPNLILYLQCYEPENMVLLPRDVMAGSEECRPYSVFILEQGTTFEEAVMHLDTIRPDVLVLSTVRTVRDRPVSDLALPFSRLVKPERVNPNGWVFDGRALIEAVGR